MELFAFGVDDEGVRFLRAVGVTHVVSPAPAAGSEAPARGLVLEGLIPVAEAGEERIYAVTQGPAAVVVTGGEPVATQFTPAGVVITLSEPRTISRVAFELSDSPWVARPTVEVSLDGLAFEPLEARASLADATLALYRDPRRGRGEVQFPPREVLFLRLDPRLPARPGAFEVGGPASRP
jgi:hypothetical protein